MKKQNLVSFLMVLFFIFSGVEGTRYFDPTTDEQKISEANTLIERTLSGGATPEASHLIRSIQEKASLGGYTSNDPIGIIFHGLYQIGKTTLAESLLQFLGKGGCILRGPERCFKICIQRDIQPNISNDHSSTFILDETDQFFIEPTDEATEEFANFVREQHKRDLESLCHCIDEAKRKNIEQGKQLFTFIGTTNYLKDVPEELLERLVPIKIETPNLEARVAFLGTLIANMPYEYKIDISACNSEVIRNAAKMMDGFPYNRISETSFYSYCEALADAKEEQKKTGQPEQEPELILTEDHLVRAIRDSFCEVVEYQDNKIVEAKRSWLVKWYEWRYDLRKFFLNKIPNFGRELIIKILACSGIKRFLKMSNYWPLSLYLKKKHS